MISKFVYMGDFEWDCSFSLFSYSTTFYLGKEYDEPDALGKAMCIDRLKSNCLLQNVHFSNISFLGGYYKLTCQSIYTNISLKSFTEVNWLDKMPGGMLFGYKTFFQNFLHNHDPISLEGTFIADKFKESKITSYGFLTRAPFAVSNTTHGICVHNPLILKRPRSHRKPASINDVHYEKSTAFFSFEKTLVKCYAREEDLFLDSFGVYDLAELKPIPLPILEYSEFFGYWHPRKRQTTGILFCSVAEQISEVGDCEAHDFTRAYPATETVQDADFLDKIYFKLTSYIKTIITILGDLLVQITMGDTSKLFSTLITMYIYQVTGNMIVAVSLGVWLYFRFS